MAGLTFSQDGEATVSEWGIDSFPNIADHGPIWSHFGVFGQPAAIVVTANGSVLGHMGDLDKAGFLALVDRARAT